MRLPFLLLACAAVPALAAEPVPEIEREPVAAQAVGARHTLRTIPEACARLEGTFTGDAAAPYRFATVRTSANCQPRARLLDAAEAEPSAAAGWKFNDLIRVPNAACPSQHAVLRVWRKPGAPSTPQLDGQGRARIYLQEAKQAAAKADGSAMPMFAAAMTVEGDSCD